MPQFSQIPSMHGVVADIPGAIQRGRENVQMNQLRQMKTEQAQGEMQRQAQLSPLMMQAAGGDRGSLTQLLGRDPSAAKKIIDGRRAMSEEDRDKVDRQREEMSRSIAYVENLPELQRPMAWRQERQRLQNAGISMDRVPDAYSPALLARAKADSQTVDKLFAEADTKAPKIETFYTPEGGSQKKAWNPETKSWDSVGGVKPPSGMRFEADGEGGFTLVQGAGAGMERKTRGGIEKTLVSAREGLARLKNIQSKFRPEFQEIPTRLGVAWTGLKARFGQGDVSGEERKNLTEFADYRRTAIANINLYIKEITGAQMSEAEAARLRLAIPDPGEGIFGGDDPITFKSKLDSIMLDLDRSAARSRYYLAKGITDPEDISQLSPLSGMRTVVNKKGDRLVEIDGQWVPIK